MTPLASEDSPMHPQGDATTPSVDDTVSSEAHVPGEELSPARPRRWLAAAQWLLTGAAALVPLAAGYVPFLGRAGIFMGHTTIPAQSAALGLFVGSALVCWAVALWRGETVLKSLPHAGVLAGFVVLVLASSVTALNKSVAVFGNDYAEQGLLALAGYVGAFVLTVQVVEGRRQFLRIMQALALSGGAVALFGVLQSVGLPYFPLAQASFLNERGTSTMGNPDMLGTFLILPLLVSLGLSVSTTGGWRWLWRAVTAVTAASLLLTQTRGAWLGALIAVVVLGVVLFRSRGADARISRSLGLTAALLALVGAGVALYKAASGAQSLFWRVAQLFSGTNADGGRLLVWSESLKALAKHPLLGAGPDNVLYAWYQIATTAHVRTMGIDGVINDAHSYWLGTAVSSGILASLLLLAFVVLLLWGSRDAISDRLVIVGRPDRVGYSALWAGVAGLCVALIFSVVLTPIGLLLWVSLGLLALPRARQARAFWERDAARYAALGLSALIGLALVVWGGLTGLSSMTEYVASGDNAARLRAATAAHRIAPWRPYPLLLEAQVLEAEGAPADQIVPVVDKLIALVPHGYEYYTIKARLLSDQPQQAMQAADQGLRVYSAGVRLLAQRALAQARIGEYDPAVRDAAAAWKIARDVVPVYREAGIGIAYAQVLGAAGKYAEAETVLDELQAAFPDDTDVQKLQSLLKSVE